LSIWRPRHQKVNSMSDRVPAEVLPPGEFLRSELHCRGWSQVQLSEILGRPPRVVSEIIAAKRAITPETAKGLAAALGTSADLWMNLESIYQLAKTPFESSKVRRRAHLYGTFPVKEMVRRGWIRQSKDMDRLEREFCRYFSISSVDEVPTFPHAAKKHLYADAPQRVQLAWLIRAEQVAKTFKVAPFSVDALRTALKELKGCLKSVEDVRKVPEILAKSGVRFVVVEFLPGAKLDGACFWIDRGCSPVVALSLRLDRLDNFWHTLFHELDHVLHGEGKDEPIVDVLDGEQAGTLPDQEARANLHAADLCIAKKTMDQWIVRVGRVSRSEIVAFAESLDVHPALIIGQLQHRGVIPYSFHRDLLEKVRDVVVTSAVTDGYGVTVRI
jgi:HTH-type transcriptional regulator / antitoxin HigA